MAVTRHTYAATREIRVSTLPPRMVFRILYFVIPFGIAISIMGTRELWLNVVRPWQERRRLNENFSTPTAVPQPLEGRQAQRVKRRQARG